MYSSARSGALTGVDGHIRSTFEENGMQGLSHFLYVCSGRYRIRNGFLFRETFDSSRHCGYVLQGGLGIINLPTWEGFDWVWNTAGKRCRVGVLLGVRALIPRNSEFMLK